MNQSKSLSVAIIVLLIGLFSLIGCDPQANPHAYENDELELGLEIPIGWSVEYKEKSALEIINNLDPGQVITISKLKNLSNEANMWAWSEDMGFPASATEYQEATVGELSALKVRSNNTLIVPNGDHYYMIQDCLVLSCKVIDGGTFLKVVDSIRFIN